MNPSSPLKINKKKKGVLTSLKLSTDPQSVAARERRHRISDRFKILRSLVPGGNSKMDTVTMLEEAIQYVKFLKAQIWLHQTMINFAEINHDRPNFIVPPNVFSGLPYNYQQVEGGFSNYFCSGVEVQSVNQLELQDSWFQGEENVAFDATSSLQYGSS